MDDLYKEIILEHYKHPRNFGKINNASAGFTLTNDLCGDEIAMEITITKPMTKNQRPATIKDIKFQGQGCALSIASASLLTEHVKGWDLHKVLTVTGKDIFMLLGVNLNHARIKCALLPLEVLHKTIGLLK